MCCNYTYQQYIAVSGNSEPLQEPVIFHSYMSSNGPPNLGTHHIIAFDAIPINKGNGYHHDNGIFEAPRPGTYVFFWTIYTYPTGYIPTQLLVNGNVISSGNTDSHAEWHGCSNSRLGDWRPRVRQTQIYSNQLHIQ